ncbi:hypothetical protein EVG20_g11328 [Dentipellis fragilis]|uniref:Uncharacterized protein n=1 Tax=Dentipellis fragilis TaxID=205917 RepID=A0A4Y9XKN3_9AGAM|nr:hypothetical protein EVG20_g11328 [Dentipellis fragilis]
MSLGAIATSPPMDEQAAPMPAASTTAPATSLGTPPAVPLGTPPAMPLGTPPAVPLGTPPATPPEMLQAALPLVQLKRSTMRCHFQHPKSSSPLPPFLAPSEADIPLAILPGSILPVTYNPVYLQMVDTQDMCSFAIAYLTRMRNTIRAQVAVMAMQEPVDHPNINPEMFEELPCRLCGHGDGEQCALCTDHGVSGAGCICGGYVRGGGIYASVLDTMYWCRM